MDYVQFKSYLGTCHHLSTLSSQFLGTCHHLSTLSSLFLFEECYPRSLSNTLSNIYFLLDKIHMKGFIE